jgi:succinate dehydrogenase / fumarate reductase iron-sulfur subunit
VSDPSQSFKGPAALAALDRELKNTDTDQKELLQLAAGPDGADGCRRALLCSRVCPTGVYPAKSIYDLLELLDS